MCGDADRLQKRYAQYAVQSFRTVRVWTARPEHAYLATRSGQPFRQLFHFRLCSKRKSTLWPTGWKASTPIGTTCKKGKHGLLPKTAQRKLPVGRKATDRNGQWQAPVTLLNLTQLPAWYETIWAYAAYVTAALLLIYVLLRLLLATIAQPQPVTTPRSPDTSQIGLFHQHLPRLTYAAQRDILRK